VELGNIGASWEDLARCDDVDVLDGIDCVPATVNAAMAWFDELADGLSIFYRADGVVFDHHWWGGKQVEET